MVNGDPGDVLDFLKGQRKGRAAAGLYVFPQGVVLAYFRLPLLQQRGRSVASPSYVIFTS